MELLEEEFLEQVSEAWWVKQVELQCPVEASEEVESQEEAQETVAAEAAPAVNYQEAAFRVA